MTDDGTLTDGANEIVTLHGELVERLQSSLEKAIRIGELLTEIKAGLPHGAFGPWVADRLPFGERTARRYVQVYRARARLETDSVSDLTSAYKLLSGSPPMTVREINGHVGESLRTQAAIGALCRFGEGIGKRDVHNLAWLFELTDQERGALYFELSTTETFRNELHKGAEQLPADLSWEEVEREIDRIAALARNRLAAAPTAWSRLDRIARQYADDPERPLTLEDVAIGITKWARSEVVEGA